MGCLRIQRGAGGGVQTGLSVGRAGSCRRNPGAGCRRNRPRAVNGTLRRAAGGIAAGLYRTVGNVTAHPN
jgi:hypothetical protein